MAWQALRPARPKGRAARFAAAAVLAGQLKQFGTNALGESLVSATPGVYVPYRATGRV